MKQQEIPVGKYVRARSYISTQSTAEVPALASGRPTAELRVQQPLSRPSAPDAGARARFCRDPHRKALLNVRNNPPKASLQEACDGFYGLFL